MKEFKTKLVDDSVKFGEQVTLTVFETNHGKIHLRENEGMLFCTFADGTKAFVGKSVKQAIENGEKCNHGNLGVVMMSYQEVNEEGVISEEKTAPMLFRQAGKEIVID